MKNARVAKLQKRKRFFRLEDERRRGKAGGFVQGLALQSKADSNRQVGASPRATLLFCLLLAKLFFFWR
jgi:hypothetical protein